MNDLTERFVQGDRRALARAVTLVENGGPDGEHLVAKVFPRTGQAHVVGFTGAPGTGKSTLVNAITRELRRRDRSVAVIAVDPTSPFSGGAVLGDRVRMSEHSGDDGVFIRSMASRGALGGLARATTDVVSVMDAAGFDYILIETVGAGQAEVEIAREAQTTVVVEVPGLGDDVQAIKAGLLEIADIFAANKADRPEVNRTISSLRMMLDSATTPYRWKPPIIKTVATSGEGIPKLVEALIDHRAFLEESGLLEKRRHERAAEEFYRALGNELYQRLREKAGQRYDESVSRIAAREIDPRTAARRLIDSL